MTYILILWVSVGGSVYMSVIEGIKNEVACEKAGKQFDNSGPDITRFKTDSFDIERGHLCLEIEK